MSFIITCETADGVVGGCKVDIWVSIKLRPITVKTVRKMSNVLQMKIRRLGKLCFAAASLLVAQNSLGQTTSTAVQSVESGNKVFLEINASQLQAELNQLFSASSSTSSTTSSLSWSDVLGNGANPGMDINFSSYEITGLGGLTSTGTLVSDSLTLNKDADITGRLSVTDVVNLEDSLLVKGYVELSDSLEVVKAVTIGETLHVTGVTSLGDSVHVVGNVDLDALFNVDGAASFGSTMTVAGETTLNDSLHVNSGVDITGDLIVNDTNLLEIINALEARIAALEAGSGGGATASFPCGTSTVSFNGYDYSTVEIDGQCWFAENLRTTQYADGTSIPEVTDNVAWSGMTTGALCAYENDVNTVDSLGYLYNMHTVTAAGGLCPTGWHVSTTAEWTALIEFVGGQSIAGLKLKASATDSPKWDGENSVGFSARPTGYRHWNTGGFYGSGYDGAGGYADALFWSVDLSAVEGEQTNYEYLNSDNGASWADAIDRGPENVYNFGYSVRCVIDE